MKKPNFKNTVNLMNYSADMMSPACAILFFILLFQLIIHYPIYLLSNILKPFEYLIKPNISIPCGSKYKTGADPYGNQEVDRFVYDENGLIKFEQDINGKWVIAKPPKL